MAITESLPVGNEVATVPGGKTATVDATAFAASFAAAGKASGGAGAGKNVAPGVGLGVAPGVAPGVGLGVPVKGQQDLAGWDAGHGLDGSVEGIVSGAGQVGVGPEAGDGSGAVSSLMGKREIVEIAEAAPGGAGNEDLQQATVGAGMQQAVWTAGAGKVDGAAGTAGNNSTGAALPGAAKLDPVSPSLLQSASALGKDVTPSAVRGNSVPATHKIAASTTPAAIPAPAESDARIVGNAEIIASSDGKVQAQVPSVATTGQPAANPAADDLAGTARIVAAAQTATTKNETTKTEAIKTEAIKTEAIKTEVIKTEAIKTEAIKTGTAEPHRVAKAGLVRAGDKGTSVSGSSRKAEVTAEATLNAAGSGGALVPSAGVEPGAVLVPQGSTPVAPAVTASPGLNEGKAAAERAGAKTESAGGSEVLTASLGVTDGVALASRSGSRGTGSPVAEVGSRTAVNGSTPGSSATAAKRGTGPSSKTGNGGEQVAAVATASTSTGDGSTALPVVVGVAAAVPQVISAAGGTETGVAGVLGAPGVTAVKGQGNAAAVKDKDGKNATSGVPRGAGEVRGTHAVAGEPVAAVTTSTAPETLGAASRNGAAHEGGSAAAVAGVASAPVAASNAHVTTATGWNGGLVTSTAPVRPEALAVTTATAASASGVAKAEDGGLNSGLGSGLSSGLVESGQGHTTLQATPTVLEVGVPGGTHGWLKIRAEMGEGGAVQASVSSATEAGQETLRKELPAMSAYLQSEHVPVSLQMAHGVATVAGATGASAADGLSAGLGFGSGAGSQAGAHPEQARNDAAAFAGASAGSADAGGASSGRQPGSDGGLGSGAVSTGLADGVSAAVASADADWTSPLGYGGVSLTTGGSWVNVIA